MPSNICWCYPNLHQQTLGRQEEDVLSIRILKLSTSESDGLGSWFPRLPTRDSSGYSVNNCLHQCSGGLGRVCTSKHLTPVRRDLRSNEHCIWYYNAQIALVHHADWREMSVKVGARSHTGPERQTQVAIMSCGYVVGCRSCEKWNHSFESIRLQLFPWIVSHGR